MRISDWSSDVCSSDLVDFPDFSFWRLRVERASLNGGFGRAYAMTPADLLTDMQGLEALLDSEAGAVAHMNADHAEAVPPSARPSCPAAPAPRRPAAPPPQALGGQPGGAGG